MGWIDAIPGNLRSSLGGLIPSDWEGPKETQIYEDKRGNANRIRATFTPPSGRKKLVEWNTRTGVVKISTIGG